MGKTPREKKPLRFQVLSDKVCHPFRGNSAEKKKSKSFIPLKIKKNGLDDFQREYSTAAWRSQLRSRVFRSAMAVVLAHIAMWLPYNCISVMRWGLTLFKGEKMVPKRKSRACALQAIIRFETLFFSPIFWFF